MKVKLSQIEAVKSSLRTFLSKELPIRIAYRFSKLVKKLDDELTDLDANRRELYKKYGKPKEDDPNQIAITEENREAFLAEIKELLDEEITVDFEPVKVDDLGDIKISSIDLANLSLFIISDD